MVVFDNCVKPKDNGPDKEDYDEIVKYYKDIEKLA
jgi:hypothetical protein